MITKVNAFRPRTLRDIQYLIQFATQSSTLYDPSKFLPSILARYTVLEERLGTLLVHFEVIIHTDILLLHSITSRVGLLAIYN